MFGNEPKLQAIAGDIRDTRSVIDAIAGVHGVVNVVGLYTESGRETFHAVHVEYAERVAMEANRAGVEQYVHVSGIGADAKSGSAYIRSRGQGELAVRAAYPGAILVRPAVVGKPVFIYKDHRVKVILPACSTRHESPSRQRDMDFMESILGVGILGQLDRISADGSGDSARTIARR